MTPIDRRSFLRTLAAGAGALAAAPGARAAERKPVDRPNIVFIVVDDMGWADLSCYGGKAIQTPHIDRMAAEGIRFTDAYAGCTVCAPSRSVLMTGYHMGHTSVRGNTGGIPLRAEDVTAGEVLKKAGYAVGGFGKWGLGDLDTPGVPERHGFDRFYGYYHQIHAHNYYPGYLIDTGKKVPLTGKPGTAERHTHYRIFEQMTRFIREHKDEPFFCYAPWTPPHASYQIPAADPAWQAVKDKPWPKQAKGHAAFNLLIDRCVGQVLALLKELGIDDRTIVFFCSDNGASNRFEGSLNSSGPLRGFKRAMYEGGIRTPLIARWPGKIKAGAVSALPCTFADMLPTWAELAGATAQVPRDIDGLSILPTLLGQADRQKRHEYLYWEWHRYNWRKQAWEPNGLMQAVRAGRWKLCRHRSDQPWELYDLETDVGEKTDLAAQKPDILKRMVAYAEAARVEPRPQIEPPKPKGKRFR